MLPHSSTNRQDAPLDLFQFFNFHSKVKARLPQNHPSLCQSGVKLLLDLIQLKVRSNC